MKASIKDNVLTIIIPISEKVSGSGKNLVIASTGGNQVTDVDYKGKKVTIGLNAYIKKD